MMDPSKYPSMTQKCLCLGGESKGAGIASSVENEGRVMHFPKLHSNGRSSFPKGGGKQAGLSGTPSLFSFPPIAENSQSGYLMV